MSILDEESPLSERPSAKSAEICRPNYEERIEILKKKHNASSELYEALMKYIEVHSVYRLDRSFTYPHLIGALDLEIKGLTSNIEQTIEKMEKHS